MFHIINLEPADNDGEQPTSAVTSIEDSVRRAHRLELHFSSVLLGGLTSVRTIIYSALQTAEEVYGADSMEFKHIKALFRHNDAVVDFFDHKIKVD